MENTSFHKVKFLFALLVLCFLFVPAIIQLSGLRQIDDEHFRQQEKRDRVKFELQSPSDFEKLKGMPDQVNRWFNDNFGLRNDLIAACARLQYDLFGKSMDIQKVVIGKNGFLFLGDYFADVLKQYMNIKYFNMNQLTVFMSSLRNIQSYLERQNIAFLFVIVPDKHSIYPEYLPARFSKIKNGHNSYDQIIERLKLSDINFVDLKNVLTKQKDNYSDRLYYKTDSHWSNIGAYIGYKAIIDKISDTFSYIDSPSMIDINILQSRYYRYDLSQMSKLTWMDDFYADVYFSKPLANLKFHDLRTDHGLQQNSNQDNFVETFEYVKVTNSEAENSYKVLMLRDSFCNALSQFFSRDFQEVTYIDHEEIDKTDFSLPQMVNKNKPDIVIFEIAERLLMYKFKDFFIVKNSLSRHDFKHLFDDTSSYLLDIKGSDIGKIIHGKSQDIKSIDVEQDVMLISSSGEDPFIEMQRFDAVAGKDSVAIKIDIQSPEDNDITQIFYQTADEPFFSESKSVSFTINKGHNIIYGKIDDTYLNGVLRIDPGRNKGTYHLNSLIIR
ncbi:MAG: hypothetical protein HQK62_07215 [Desulfamplus sp.]|nr:hypothetical protein [Desulfamplus sp.]